MKYEGKDNLALASPDPKGQFIAAMLATQDDRTEAAGGHIWRSHVAEYGPAILFAEIASINARLKQIFWDTGLPASEVNLKRAEDLLIDLGNYSSFLHTWVIEELQNETH